MKNLQKLFSMTMLVCMVATLFSCSKDDEKEMDVAAGIVGSWEIVSAEVLVGGMNLDSYIEQEAQKVGMSADLFKESFGELFNFDFEGDFNFMEDKKFVSEVEGEKESGTWSANGEKLIIETQDGETNEFTVKSLTSTDAIISSQEKDEDTGIVTEVNFSIKKK